MRPQAAGKPGANANDGNSFNRAHPTHKAAKRPQAAVKPNPDASGGSSPLASGAPELPLRRSTPSTSPASPHDPQQQSAKGCQPGQGAAAKPTTSSAECKGGKTLASTGQGQAAQNRAAAGHPLARRRLVKAAHLPLPDTQVYEHPRPSPWLIPTSLIAADSPSSADQREATARTAQAARSPVMSPRDQPADDSLCGRFSPGAMPGKRQKHGSNVAGDAGHSPGLSQSAEDSGISAAPGSPAMSGSMQLICLVVVKVSHLTLALSTWAGKGLMILQLVPKSTYAAARGKLGHT